MSCLTQRLHEFKLTALADRCIETAAAVRVTGRTGLRHDHQQTIAIAVDPHIDQPLPVARAFALAPVGLPGARPVSHLPGRERLDHGVDIHPGHHQNRAGLILSDRRKKALVVVFQTLGETTRIGGFDGFE